MKKPKLRIPRAKPQRVHSGKKKPSNVGKVELLTCSKCKGEFFVVVSHKGTDLCLGCSNAKG